MRGFDPRPADERRDTRQALKRSSDLSRERTPDSMGASTVRPCGT